MVEHIDLNNGWKYSTLFHEDMIKFSYDESGMEEVRIPHTNQEVPFHYFDEGIYQFISGYRKTISVPDVWKGKRALLTFNGVAHIAKVYVNEKFVDIHYGGYTAFTLDISKYLKYPENPEGEMDNLIVVEVDSREQNNIPPFGHVVDYLTYGGIYREVFLDIKELTYIKDIFVKSMRISGECESKAFHGISSKTNEDSSEVCNHSTVYHEDNSFLTYRLTCETRLEGIIHSGLHVKFKLLVANTQYSKNKTIPSPRWEDGAFVVKQERDVFTIDCFDVGEWDLDTPLLYDLHCTLYDQGNHTVDEMCIRIGFREFEFKVDGFYLNSRKIKILGLNRHQSYPYVGYAMPKGMQERDADLLKYELSLNAVRTSHYPQSQHFINRCDEIGLLVFTELPGWQYIGDAQWQQVALDNLREMIVQYRNHPSIIIWGVRINESQDNDEFYQRTNDLAHMLDDSRARAGVRCFQQSHLLEDVYTYNDFIHNGSNVGLERKKKVSSNLSAPYLVSEYNGHMYPTKPFDDEAHRLEHALRHARVLNSLFEQEDILGGFGWCMFDYNTHKDFGSGDKICYHGVMDMFRNPKQAAYVYSSQGQKETIGFLSSTMDIGEHPAGYLGDIYLYTNGDAVKLYKNNQYIRQYTRKDSGFSNLPNPPILIDDFIGDLLERKEGFSNKSAEGLKKILTAIAKYGQYNLPLRYKLKMLGLMMKEKLRLSDGVRLYSEYVGNWGSTATTYRFDVVKEGKVVKQVMKGPVGKPRMKVEVNTLILREEATYDVAAIRITAVDEYGNGLAYYQEPIQLEVSGAIELIGPEVISFKGGATGTYVKSKSCGGEGMLHIKQLQLGEEKLHFQVLHN